MVSTGSLWTGGRSQRAVIAGPSPDVVAFVKPVALLAGGSLQHVQKVDDAGCVRGNFFPGLGILLSFLWKAAVLNLLGPTEIGVPEQDGNRIAVSQPELECLTPRFLQEIHRDDGVVAVAGSLANVERPRYEVEVDP